MTVAAVAALCSSVLVLSAVRATDKAPGDWPAFRGPMATGVAPGGDPPVEWSETKNIRWKAPLEGEGHASPIVWGDRIYLLAAIKVETAAATPPPAPPAADPNAPPPDPNAPRPRPQRQKPSSKYQFTVMAFERATGKPAWRTVVSERPSPTASVSMPPSAPTASTAST
jgi:hypothetical protein